MLPGFLAFVALSLHPSLIFTLYSSLSGVALCFPQFIFGSASVVELAVVSYCVFVLRWQWYWIYFFSFLFRVATSLLLFDFLILVFLLFAASSYGGWRCVWWWSWCCCVLIIIAIGFWVEEREREIFLGFSDFWVDKRKGRR